LTFRQKVRISRGGELVRIKLTNELGIDSLSIGQVTLALDQGAVLYPDRIKTLTFGGRHSIVIPPGAIAISDPIRISLPLLSHLSLSIFIPSQPIQRWTHHPLGLETDAVAPGNQTTQPELSSSRPITSSYFLKAIDVECDGDCAAIAALGDSITDGQGSTNDADRRWPDIVASRLASLHQFERLSIFNEGISGNRLLHDGRGPGILSRLDRDVLAQSGVQYLIVLIGINDIGRATRAKDPADPVSIADLAWGLSQLAERAHQKGIKVFTATLTPAGHGSISGEALRSGLNDWIRTSKIFDGVIDFDAIVRDPQHPTQMLPRYDSGDSLHLSDEGYKKMGDSIDLNIFSPTPHP
jgi:lysophospholipase L1-like esterase